MTGKSSGLGDNLYVAGRNMSGDTNSIERIGCPIGVLPVTGIDKFAFERIKSTNDGELGWRSYFNKDAARAHSWYSTLPKTDVIISYFRGVTAAGRPAASLIGLETDYAGKRDEDGGFLFDLNAVANSYGLEWGIGGTAGVRTDTAATNGTGIDLGGATSFGLQAYLQVFTGFVGTSVTVKLQGSSDNGVGDAFADITGGAFTAATGVTSQRIATATNLAVERYIRVVTTGTFTNAAFAVTLHVNPLAVTQF